MSMFQNINDFMSLYKRYINSTLKALYIIPAFPSSFPAATHLSYLICGHLH